MLVYIGTLDLRQMLFASVADAFSGIHHPSVTIPHSSEIVKPSSTCKQLPPLTAASSGPPSEDSSRYDPTFLPPKIFLLAAFCSERITPLPG